MLVDEKVLEEAREIIIQLSEKYVIGDVKAILFFALEGVRMSTTADMTLELSDIMGRE